MCPSNICLNSLSHYDHESQYFSISVFSVFLSCMSQLPLSVYTHLLRGSLQSFIFLKTRIFFFFHTWYTAMWTRLHCHEIVQFFFLQCLIFLFPLRSFSLFLLSDQTDPRSCFSTVQVISVLFSLCYSVTLCVNEVKVIIEITVVPFHFWFYFLTKIRGENDTK